MEDMLMVLVLVSCTGVDELGVGESSLIHWHGLVAFYAGPKGNWGLSLLAGEMMLSEYPGPRIETITVFSCADNDYGPRQ
jgi:hypothetical protein